MNLLNSKNRFLLIVVLAASFVIACISQESNSSTDVDLLTAVAYADIDNIKEHIKFGTDINTLFVETEDWKGAGALHIAAISPKNPETIKQFKTVIELLLEGGADIDIRARNEEEATPLGWATYFGKLDMVEFLVDKGANLNKPDKNGYTPLDAAITSPFMGSELNRSAITKFLKDKGAKTGDR